MAIDYSRMNAAILRDHGTSASYGGSPLTVVHMRQYVEALDVAGYHQTADVYTSDATTLGITYGGTLVIGSDSYIVRGMDSDDGGMTRLMLESV